MHGPAGTLVPTRANGVRERWELAVSGLADEATATLDSALDAALRTLHSVLCTQYSVLYLFQVGLTVLGRPVAGHVS
jgi:hypothetical protein